MKKGRWADCCGVFSFIPGKSADGSPARAHPIRPASPAKPPDPEGKPWEAPPRAQPSGKIEDFAGGRGERRLPPSESIEKGVWFMAKRVLILAGALLLSLSLAACGGPREQAPTLATPSSGIEQTPVDANGFDDDLAGLCQYMEANQAVTGEKIEMSYKEIGAVNGFRYLFKFDGSTVQAEFYEFDLDNLDEKGNACISSVREKGFFSLLGNDVPATLEGKYLMIYTDGDSDEVNTAQKEKVLNLFQDFARGGEIQ